jgi:predicted transcriptional regulator
MTSPDKELKEKIAAEAEHAEASRDADLPYRRRRPARSSVYGLRLPDERIDQLRRLAEARGVEPSVLVRQWVIEHLEAAERARDANSQRWERDFRATTDHLRELLDQRPWADAS